MTESAETELPTSSAMQHRRRSAILLSVVIFLCGALVGGAGTVIGINYYLAYRFQHPEQMLLRIITEMEGNLKLTPEQRAQVTTIFEMRHSEIDQMFEREIKPKIEAQFDSLRDEVASVLDEQQAVQWKRDFNEMRARLRPPGGGPPGPPFPPSPGP